jgi:hypothetical protein
LLVLLEGLSSDESQTTRVAEIADLIKSEYFRLSDDELRVLDKQFDEQHLELLRTETQLLTRETVARLKNRYSIGFWDADSLENAFAYVGSDLSVSAWLTRAHKLYTDLPGAAATKELLNIDRARTIATATSPTTSRTPKSSSSKTKASRKKRRPSRDVHPPRSRGPRSSCAVLPSCCMPCRAKVSLGVARGVDATAGSFWFSRADCRAGDKIADEQQLPQVMLNFNALEALRRAFMAAIKSIDLAANSPAKTRLSTFLQEVRRSLASQSQVFGAPDRNGLRILEATDVRGLRFRAVL